MNTSHSIYFGRLMIDLAGPSISSEERAMLANPHVGGVILFARNLEDRDQVCRLVSQIRYCSSELLIAVDQEGGRVQRLINGFTRLPPMQLLGDLIAASPAEGISLTYETGWLMASEVLACGIDFSFAPVLDVDRDTSTIIGDRAFSDCPNIVTRAAEVFIEGMGEAGMASTGKHFPGHGGIMADSHLVAPIDNRVMKELLDKDIKPFSALSKKLCGIMPAHITFPKIEQSSVGFSSFWLKHVLRSELGFEGIIFSDDLSMKGADVVGGYTDKARLALSAGCDMILVCNCPEGAVEVLSYMEEQDICKSSSLGVMKSRKVKSWSYLVKSDRRYRVIKKLSKLMI
jgi:beta-N-acetylhexosaminidase